MFTRKSAEKLSTSLGMVRAVSRSVKGWNMNRATFPNTPQSTAKAPPTNERKRPGVSYRPTIENALETILGACGAIETFWNERILGLVSNPVV